MAEDSDDLNELIEAKSIMSDEEQEGKQTVEDGKNSQVSANRHQIMPTPLNSVGTGVGFKPARM